MGDISEYRAKIELLSNVFRQRMYHQEGVIEYNGFFTNERLSLDEASTREKLHYTTLLDGTEMHL